MTTQGSCARCGAALGAFDGVGVGGASYCASCAVGAQQVEAREVRETGKLQAQRVFGAIILAEVLTGGVVAMIGPSWACVGAFLIIGLTIGTYVVGTKIDWW